MDKNIKMYAIEKMASDNVGKNAAPMDDGGEPSEWKCPDCDTEVMVSRPVKMVKCPMCGCRMEEYESDEMEDETEDEED